MTGVTGIPGGGWGLTVAMQDRGLGSALALADLGFQWADVISYPAESGHCGVTD